MADCFTGTYGFPVTGGRRLKSSISRWQRGSKVSSVPGSLAAQQRGPGEARGNAEGWLIRADVRLGLGHLCTQWGSKRLETYLSRLDTILSSVLAGFSNIIDIESSGRSARGDPKDLVRVAQRSHVLDQASRLLTQACAVCDGKYEVHTILSLARTIDRKITNSNLDSLLFPSYALRNLRDDVLRSV